jgi:undecaprenyl diphosphate synthase
MPNEKINHVALIMDGNRRWAKERNLPSIEGHAKGYEKLRESVDWFFARGVNVVSAYAFSAENWQRSHEEVNYLMKLLEKALRENLEGFKQKGYKLLLSGRVEELPGDLPEICNLFVNDTKDNTNGILNICLNYGGRTEIVDAVKKIIKNDISLEQVHEGMIRKYLYQGDLPDPDVIVRTSGEQRLSGFLLWQSAYSEMIFLNKFWPEFEKNDVDFIIEEYGKRQRRFGT